MKFPGRVYQEAGIEQDLRGMIPPYVSLLKRGEAHEETS
jgi:hypothetical protein